MAKSKKKKSSDKSEERVNTSLRLRKTTLKQLKVRAIEEDSSVQKIVEKLILDYLNH